jgi:hypothetical protein
MLSLLKLQATRGKAPMEGRRKSVCSMCNETMYDASQVIEQGIQIDPSFRYAVKPWCSCDHVLCQYCMHRAFLKCNGHTQCESYENYVEHIKGNFGNHGYESEDYESEEDDEDDIDNDNRKNTGKRSNCPFCENASTDDMFVDVPFSPKEFNTAFAQAQLPTFPIEKCKDNCAMCLGNKDSEEKRRGRYNRRVSTYFRFVRDHEMEYGEIPDKYMKILDQFVAKGLAEWIEDSIHIEDTVLDELENVGPKEMLEDAGPNKKLPRK